MEDVWWVQKAQEIRNLADCNNTLGFYDAIKALYGPRKRAIALFIAQLMELPFLRTVTTVLGRWTNHFATLLNHTNPVDFHILDGLPDLPPIAHVDIPLQYCETHQAIRDLKNN